MSLPPPSSLLEQVLRRVARRYRLPELPDLSGCASTASTASPATTLAYAIEQARDALACNRPAARELQPLFIDALAQMIRDALRPLGDATDARGDPVFQAMVLRHRAVHVREYASLSAHAERDRRQLHASVKSIAHPARQRAMSDAQRDALGTLDAALSAGSYRAFSAHVQHVLALAEIANEPSLSRRLMQLRESAELHRLLRIEALSADDDVHRYQALWVRQGPRSGSSAALAQGAASQQRGAAAEALATHALRALADRLNEHATDAGTYRVVTSMRVPSSIPASHERAKSEWDAVLLERASSSSDAQTSWNVRLLVEAKASVDAATTDFARLVRGLRLLAHAHAQSQYSFDTAQGAVCVSGASLHGLPLEGARLQQTVLYCCHAPAEPVARLLGAASRMQLLSAQPSLEFASALIEHRPADRSMLVPVWQQLLDAPQWRPLLNQYSTLRRVRELMVHADDLLDAVEQRGD